MTGEGGTIKGSHGLVLGVLSKQMKTMFVIFYSPDEASDCIADDKHAKYKC